jgi:hypothetical protein
MWKASNQMQQTKEICEQEKEDGERGLFLPNVSGQLFQ